MDTIANMLIGLKNASLVKKSTVLVPHSKLKLSILNVLKNEGYVKAVNVTGDEKKPVIEVVLNYNGDTPKIVGVTRVSKPSKRVYKKVADIKPVRYGHGIAILSTPKGIMTAKEARKEMVGGEVLFTMW